MGKENDAQKTAPASDDIRASLREAHDYVLGKPTKAIVHRVQSKGKPTHAKRG